MNIQKNPKKSPLILALMMMMVLTNVPYGHAQQQASALAPETLETKELTQADLQCNAIQTGFNDLLKIAAEKQAKLNADSDEYADKLVKRIVAASAQSESNLAMMGDINQDLINELSMDPGSFGNSYEDKAVKSLNKLAEVKELTGNLDDQMIQFKKQMQTLLPQVRSNMTKSGDEIEGLAKHVPGWLGGNKLRKGIQEKRDAMVTVKDALAVMNRGVDEYAKKVDTYRNLIPTVIAETGVKNQKARIINGALKKVMDNYKEFLANNENNPDLTDEMRRQHESTITGLSELLVIGEKILASNMNKIIQLSTAHNQIMKAARDMNVHGRLALKELAMDLAMLDVTNLSATINKMNMQLVSLSTASSDAVLASLKAGKDTQVQLEAKIKAAAEKLKINNKEVIKLSIDALNGTAKKLAYNEDLIAIFKEITKESELAEEMLKKERASMGLLTTIK